MRFLTDFTHILFLLVHFISLILSHKWLVLLSKFLDFQGCIRLTILHLCIRVNVDHDSAMALGQWQTSVQQRLCLLLTLIQFALESGT